jgi:hypothetical protein
MNGLTDYQEPLRRLFFVGPVHFPQLASQARLVHELVRLGLAQRTPSGYFIITSQGVETCVAQGWDLLD